MNSSSKSSSFVFLISLYCNPVVCNLFPVTGCTYIYSGTKAQRLAGFSLVTCFSVWIDGRRIFYFNNTYQCSVAINFANKNIKRFSLRSGNSSQILDIYVGIKMIIPQVDQTLTSLYLI